MVRCTWRRHKRLSFVFLLKRRGWLHTECSVQKYNIMYSDKVFLYDPSLLDKYNEMFLKNTQFRFTSLKQHHEGIDMYAPWHQYLMALRAKRVSS